jgi:hypothetical protein
LKEIVMNPIRHIRRLAAALTGLAGTLLAFAAAPAAFAAMSVPPPGAESAGITPPPGWNKNPPLPAQSAAAVAEHHESLTGGLPAPLAAHIHQQAPQAPGPVPIHAVVFGGMPGWQIALIAIGTALFAATAAVLLDRAWTGRRRSATAAA